MSLFLRVFRHLLPDADAWRLREDGTRPIERFFRGLAGTPSDARAFADSAYLDLYPDSTRELDQHSFEFGLIQTGTEAQQRAALAAAWAAVGGQSKAYIQGRLQAAGFDVYVHEWWASGPPWVARDPRTYTDQVLIGTVQCDEALALCGESSALCNGFLQNNPLYLVNETLSRRPPPPVPDDPTKWPYFIYIGGATFPDLATVPLERRLELEQLVLQLRPLNNWVVMLIDYVTDDEDGFFFSGPDGELSPLS